jgi:hypothetical protein
MQSTLYPKCPKCRANGLLQEIQGKYLCANCNYDYTSLKDNKEELDKMLVEQLQAGPMGQLTALELNRRITLMPNSESIEYVKQLAQKNGIELPKPKKGMCFIATACYEDFDSIEVLVFRLFRDKYLLNNFIGKIFVEIYYLFSPPVAELLSHTVFLKNITKTYILNPLYKKALKKIAGNVQK